MKMKKIFIFIIIAIISITNLCAFNEFIPAAELSGRFPKFSTYYHKQYSNFSEGFSDIGVMLSYPELLKNFSFGADFKRFGDDKFNDLEVDDIINVDRLFGGQWNVNFVERRKKILSE